MDANHALRQKYRQFHVQAVSMPSPDEAVAILRQYKEALEALSIKSPRFQEIVFDPIRRRFSIIARRDIEDEVTRPLLEILRTFPFTNEDDNDDDDSTLDVIAYKDSFIPGAFLSWPASGVYTGLREEDGTMFSYVTILRHFGVDNAHFKRFLSTAFDSALQVGTSWDAKLFYVGARDQRTVDMAIDIFHGLRIQMMRNLAKDQAMAQMTWEFEHGQDHTAGLRQWVAGLEGAETVSEPSEEDLEALCETKEVEEDLLQLA